MASVNKVILLGNLGRDPELRYTPSGMAVANFSIATTSGGGRDREPQTEWHKIVVYDKQAELCNQYLSKGRQVYIEGRIQTRSWDDKKSGEKRYSTEIIANQVVFLNSGERGAGGGERGAGGGERGAGGGERNMSGGRGGRGDYDQGGYQDRAPARGRGGYDQAPPDHDDMPAPSFPDDDDIPF